jgi:benzodiazapine receptor
MKINNTGKLIAAVAICQAAGGLGAIATAPKITSWYANLIKPEFSPPNWLFGPVWTILYLLMGIALFLVWKERKSKEKRRAVGVFVVQLGLNILWSFLFFGMENPGAALVEIILMWMAIAATISEFGKINKTAGWLLVPYLLWVSFATVLNGAVYWLNR